MTTATATCSESAFSWSFNSLGQSPCLVGAYLGGVCNAGQFNVGPLDLDKVYLGPTVEFANECRCSSVFYNLISACAGCQAREYLRWSEYNTNCTTVYPGVFTRSIPSGTRVPHYAYLNPTVDDTFNITAAMEHEVLTAPESTATVAQQTGASTKGLTPTSVASSSKSSNAGPIAGGVVGGVVGLTLIAALVFWWTRRRRSRTAPSSEVNAYTPPLTTSTPMGYNPATISSTYTATPAPLPSPKLYDPADPSTYPTTTAPGPLDYTSSNQGFLHPNSTGSSYPSNPVPAGRYTGAPEL